MKDLTANHRRTAFLARPVLTTVAFIAPFALLSAQSTAGSDPQPVYDTAQAAGEVTISPASGGDDTVRIQRAIDSATGAIRFKAGVYRLYGPLRLRSNRSYIGEGSWDPRYGSVLLQQKPGEAIFSVDELITTVRITGLAFDGAPGANAKGIAARNSAAVLALSILRGNFFLTGLADCIDTPMQSTRIEENQFGVNGGLIGSRHRHIRSISAGQNIETNANWIVGNHLRQARGNASVLFEQGAVVHIIGNNFEDNRAETTLRINGMFQAVIKDNYFEQNAGEALMTFANAPNLLGNYIVRLENNYYHMGGAAGLNAPNQFVFTVDRSGARRSFPGQTQVFMGYEAGAFFSPSAKLVPDGVFDSCYLFIISPERAFRLNGYTGRQTAGNPSCR